MPAATMGCDSQCCLRPSRQLLQLFVQSIKAAESKSLLSLLVNMPEHCLDNEYGLEALSVTAQAQGMIAATSFPS